MPTSTAICLAFVTFAFTAYASDIILPSDPSDEGRLFVSDATANHVHVYDLVQGTWMDTPLPGLLPSSTLPYTTADGKYIVVSSRTGNAISFIDAGLVVVSDVHGDAVLRGKPVLSDVTLSQSAPGHVSTHDGRLVVFFDGTLRTPQDADNYRNATAFIFAEHELGFSSASDVNLQTLFSEHAHHGNAWPAPGCNWVHSLYETDEVLPSTFVVLNSDMVETQRFDNACAAYHGYAMTSNNVAITGCGSVAEGAGHLMVMSYNEETQLFAVKSMKFPSATARSGTVWSYGSMTTAIATYGNSNPDGYHAVVRVDPTKDDLTTADVLEFPATAWSEDALTGAYGTCFLGVMKGNPHHIVAMLPDGQLYFYNSDTLAQVAIVDVFPEVRSTLVRSSYSCAEAMQVKVELGRTAVMVYKMDAKVMLRFDVGKTSVSAGVDVGMPAISALGDMIVAIPTASKRSECKSAAQDTDASASTSNDDSSDTTIVVLATLLAVVIVLLLVLAVMFVLFTRRMANYRLIKPAESELSTL